MPISKLQNMPPLLNSCVLWMTFLAFESCDRMIIDKILGVIEFMSRINA